MSINGVLSILCDELLAFFLRHVCGVSGDHVFESANKIFPCSSQTAGAKAAASAQGCQAQSPLGTDARPPLILSCVTTGPGGGEPGSGSGLLLQGQLESAGKSCQPILCYWCPELQGSRIGRAGETCHLAARNIHLICRYCCSSFAAVPVKLLLSYHC